MSLYKHVPSLNSTLKRKYLTPTPHCKIFHVFSPPKVLFNCKLYLKSHLVCSYNAKKIFTLLISITIPGKNCQKIIQPS